jgi:hypothetical protein
VEDGITVKRDRLYLTLIIFEFVCKQTFFVLLGIEDKVKVDDGVCSITQCNILLAVILLL